MKLHKETRYRQGAGPYSAPVTGQQLAMATKQLAQVFPYAMPVTLLNVR